MKVISESNANDTLEEEPYKKQRRGLDLMGINSHSRVCVIGSELINGQETGKRAN